MQALITPCNIALILGDQFMHLNDTSHDSCVVLAVPQSEAGRILKGQIKSVANIDELIFNRH
jgi:hypothetical protein